MRYRSVFVTVIVFGFLAASVANAAVIYEASDFESNFIPLGNDGSEGRPKPGNRIGNEITLGGGPRLLTDATVRFGWGNNGDSPLAPTLDIYTLRLYQNDGADGAPGTLIAESTASAMTDTVFDVSFLFDNILLPTQFTVAISSSHPSDGFFDSRGLVGPLSTQNTAKVGSSLDALWMNTDDDGTHWTLNGDWAVTDGASTNRFNMRLTAVPEAHAWTLSLAGATAYLLARRSPR